MNRFTILRRLLIALAVLLALLLAACGGGDDDDAGDGDQDVTPDETPFADDDDDGPSAPDETPTPLPTELPLPTATPFLPPDEEVFEEASAEVAIDIASNTGISLDELEILEPDTVLYLDEPLLCPEVPEDAPEVYYVYAQHEQVIYAYQVIPSTQEGVEPLVQQCEDEFIDDEVLYVPDPEAAPSADPVAAVRAHLEARDIDPDAGVYTVTEMVWSDEALGCPDDAGIEDPISAAIEGYLVLVEIGDVTYEYHTDLTGEQVVYCAPPPGFETAEDFIAVIVAEQQDLEAEALPTDEEVAVYNGLDRAGTLMEFGIYGSRVGVFGFESEAAARAAAQQIDDTVVSHIFVSGNVLLVMEENDLSVYGMLQDYATEVRNIYVEEQESDLLDTGDDDDDDDDDDLGDDDDDVAEE